VILRLRAKGVTNAISVVAYTGNEKWMSQTWWKGPLPRRRRRRLDRPGLYVSAEPGYYHHGMFADLLDRKAADGPGFYDWAVRRHPTKPVTSASTAPRLAWPRSVGWPGVRWSTSTSADRRPAS
jgi:hypothetical protein